MVDVLAVIEVAVYIFLVNPATYVLFRHGKKGILGWLAIQSFCFTRIIGNILILKDGEKSTSATIVSSIGLSPLLIGTLGILHEAREARHPKLRRGREWCFVLNFHGLITAGMVLIVLGIAAMMNNKETHTTDGVMKLGMVIMVICYMLAWLWTGFSFFNSQQELSSPAYEDGSTLLRGVVLALPFIGIRLIYGIIIFLDMINHKQDATFPTSKPLKYLMSALPELAAVSILCFVGVKTRHIKQAIKAAKYTRVEGIVQGKDARPMGDGVPLPYLPPQQERIYEPYKQQYPLVHVQNS